MVSTTGSKVSGDSSSAGPENGAETVALPSGLQSPTFGRSPNQKVGSRFRGGSSNVGPKTGTVTGQVALPSNLQSFTVHSSPRNLQKVTSDSGLESFAILGSFDRNLEEIAMSSGVQRRNGHNEPKQTPATTSDGFTNTPISRESLGNDGE